MQPDNNSSETPMREDEIDETLEESFPASDPPSWSLGTDHRDQKSENDKRADAENES